MGLLGKLTKNIKKDVVKNVTSGAISSFMPEGFEDGQFGEGIGKLLGNAKSAGIKKIAELDYSKMPQYMESIPAKYEHQKNLASKLLVLIEGASNEYNCSSENKEEVFISYLANNADFDLEETIKVIEPIWEYVPGGKIINIGLKYVAKK